MASLPKSGFHGRYNVAAQNFSSFGEPRRVTEMPMTMPLRSKVIDMASSSLLQTSGMWHRKAAGLVFFLWVIVIRGLQVFQIEGPY